MVRDFRSWQLNYKRRRYFSYYIVAAPVAEAASDRSADSSDSQISKLIREQPDKEKGGNKG